MDLILQPFTLGTSTVVTLPKKWGVTPPAKLKAKKIGKKITLVVVDKQSQLEKDLALIEKLAGGMKYSSNLTPDEMNRVYDQEVYGD